ncbi:MAG: 2Fe-2S iron-sulfur cluster binding domain-containing protein [Cohaesibacteraceae bacterium]|nr:2Fe-2S iron-sulfur cluster binding domain-containing protein [Cohaesibacteraceae bacterium]
MTPGFHNLTIQSITSETSEAVSLTFSIPDELANEYQFVPGQYLTLNAPIDGENVRRSYSICSAPKQETISVAIKSVDGGRFSNFAMNSLNSGDSLEVMPPSGRFVLPEKAENSIVYAAFVAGSGITPVISMIREVLSRATNSKFFLFYGNKSSQSTIFKDELDALKDMYMGRFSVFYVYTREEQELEILNGRFSDSKIRSFLTHVLPAVTIDHFFLCGPGEMIETARKVLSDLGVADTIVHTEYFTPADGSNPHGAHVAKDIKAVDHVSTVTILTDGARYTGELQPGETIIDLAIRMKLEVPYSCKGGMCCTCRAKVTSGEVDMAINYSLEQWEVEAGFVLTCQSRPKSQKVTVDFDEM